MLKPPPPALPTTPCHALDAGATLNYLGFFEPITATLSLLTRCPSLTLAFHLAHFCLPLKSRLKPCLFQEAFPEETRTGLGVASGFETSQQLPPAPRKQRTETVSGPGVGPPRGTSRRVQASSGA